MAFASCCRSHISFGRTGNFRNERGGGEREAVNRGGSAGLVACGLLRAGRLRGRDTVKPLRKLRPSKLEQEVFPSSFAAELSSLCLLLSLAPWLACVCDCEMPAEPSERPIMAGNSYALAQ